MSAVAYLAVLGDFKCVYAIHLAFMTYYRSICPTFVWCVLSNVFTYRYCKDDPSSTLRIDYILCSKFVDKRITGYEINGQ